MAYLTIYLTCVYTYLALLARVFQPLARDLLMAASSDEESDAESAYDLPIVRFAEKPYPASIYTFLGLATLPRLFRAMLAPAGRGAGPR